MVIIKKLKTIKDLKEIIENQSDDTEVRLCPMVNTHSKFLLEVGKNGAEMEVKL